MLRKQYYDYGGLLKRYRFSITYVSLTINEHFSELVENRFYILLTPIAT